MAVFRLWPSACSCQVIGMLQKVRGEYSTWPCHQAEKGEHLGNQLLELLRDDGVAERKM